MKVDTGRVISIAATSNQTFVSARARFKCVGVLTQFDRSKCQPSERNRTQSRLMEFQSA